MTNDPVLNEAIALLMKSTKERAELLAEVATLRKDLEQARVEQARLELARLGAINEARIVSDAAHARYDAIVARAPTDAGQLGYAARVGLAASDARAALHAYTSLAASFATPEDRS